MDYLNPGYEAPKKGNIKITLASLVDSFQEFLTKRNYFLYNITTKTQINDIKQTKVYNDLHEQLRSITYSHFYDDYTFYAKDTFDVERVKLIFMACYLDLLEENDIDLSNNELVTNNDVNIEHFDLAYKWCNFNTELIRTKAYEMGIFKS
ncbi:hypothetical phage protein [Campylobacter phage CP220]|uniref:Hypothetical phage protein n=1 Tax=Campylobacter phage CP220 TaxID=2994044 RepID=D5GV88_9CAUD|nr:hypothetical protein APL47_gp096 [Campylobacter phage CP220]CBJ93905.1 hypothetical phage protein [Campylobacter phage CP220]